MRAMLHIFYLISCLVLFPVVMFSQIPEWEDPVQLGVSSGRSLESAFSNGRGQHLGIARSSNAKHYLIGNDGVTILSSPDFGDARQGVTAVTAFGQFVNVVCRHNVETSHDVIRLQRSSNGGEHWLSTPLEYEPAAHFS